MINGPVILVVLSVALWCLAAGFVAHKVLADNVRHGHTAECWDQ